jgi:hypothetical protein
MAKEKDKTGGAGDPAAGSENKGGAAGAAAGASKAKLPKGVESQFMGDDNVVMFILDEDIDGNPILEGQRPTVIAEIWLKGKDYETVKTDRIKLNKREKDLKEDLKALYRKFPNQFTASANNPNLFVWNSGVGGLVIDVEREESFELKTHKDVPPPINTTTGEKNKADVAPLKRGAKNKDDKSPENIF